MEVKMPDVAQTPLKADGGEGKGPNAEAELKAQEEAQAEQARKEAKDAQKAKAVTDEVMIKAQEGLNAKADEISKISAEPIGQLDIEGQPGSTISETPTEERQASDVGQPRVPEQPSTPQQMPQEPAAQPVNEAKVTEENKTVEEEPRVAEKTSNSIWNLFGLFGSKPKKKSNQDNIPHPVSEKIAESGNPEDIERIAVEDKPARDKPVQTTEVGEDPENKQ